MTTARRGFGLFVLGCLLLSACTKEGEPRVADSGNRDTGADVAADSGPGGDVAPDSPPGQDGGADATADTADEADAGEQSDGENDAPVEDGAGTDADDDGDGGAAVEPYTIGATCDSATHDDVCRDGNPVSCGWTGGDAEREVTWLCDAILPTESTCVADCFDGFCRPPRCYATPGEQCLFDTDEWQVAELPPWFEGVFFPPSHYLEQTSAVMVPCAGDHGGCLIGDDGVGRCAEDMPVCDYSDVPACGGADGDISVIACDELNIDGEGLPLLARRCESADSCGVTCTGLPDGQACIATRVLHSFLWGVFELPCGPFSRCNAESQDCEPRSCANTTGTGACTNTADCAALAEAGGLEGAFEVVLECAEANPETIGACVAAEVGLTTACGGCFGDLEGDFEACAGI